MLPEVVAAEARPKKESERYGLFKNIDRNNYKHNSLYLALKAGGLSDLKLQHLILTLRNRTIHRWFFKAGCD